MTLTAILGYCFLFGLLHGILPDEHTWPITFSYAISSGSGAKGMRAGIYFSAAFTIQRMLISELSYLALGRFIKWAAMDAVSYIVIGAMMSLAGWLLLSRGRYMHLHMLGHHHETRRGMDTSTTILGRRHSEGASDAALPVRWTLAHGFIAGFGFGGFSLYVNGIAAPTMPNAWFGFVPGLLYGSGTIVTLAAVSAFFALSVRFFGGLNEHEAQRLGARVGAMTLLFGGFLFIAGGIAMVAGVGRYLPINTGYVVITLFVVAVVVPVFLYVLRDLASEPKPAAPEEIE